MSWIFSGGKITLDQHWPRHLSCSPSGQLCFLPEKNFRGCVCPVGTIKSRFRPLLKSSPNEVLNGRRSSYDT